MFASWEDEVVLVARFPESLWWTNTYKADDGLTQEVGGREMPFVEVFDLLVHRFLKVTGRVFRERRGR